MKKLLLLSFSAASLLVQAQQFETVNFPASFVRTADVFQGKLVIAGTGPVLMYDGSAWSEVPNTSRKYSARTIGNLLYMGSGEFSTNGENIIHVYDGSTTTEKQGHRQFSYNANKKIVDFVSVGDSIYTCDRNQPFVWDNSLGKWRDISRPAGILSNYSIEGITSFNDHPAIITGNEVFYLNAQYAWDSIGLSNYEVAAGRWMGSIASYYKKGNDLYLVGSFTRFTSPTTGEYGNILRLSGSDYQLMKCYFGQDSTPARICRLGRIFVDDNGDIYLTALKDPDVNDVSLVKFNGSAATDLGQLVAAGQGSLPQFPGSELFDYNIIFKYNNELYVGGRFVTIAGDSISGLARYKGGPSSGLKLPDPLPTLTLYPVPASDELHFGAGNIRQVKVMNVLGEVVTEQAVTGNSLRITHLPAGSYMIVATDSSGRISTGRFIKQ